MSDFDEEFMGEWVDPEEEDPEEEEDDDCEDGILL